MRRTNGLGIVLLIVALIAIEYYAFTAVKFSIKNLKAPQKNILFGAYVALTLLWLGMFLAIPMLRAGEFSKPLRTFIVVFGVGFFLSKVLNASIFLIDDIRRMGYYIVGLFYSKQEIPQAIQSGMTRSQFLAKSAILMGGALYATLLYGMTNRYNYHVRKIKLSFANLPNAFKGLKIIQISDIHSGSFNDMAAVQKGIDKILEQKPDVIFFTGDLVNDRSEEMKDYMHLFSQLKAPMGVYSIFGNHDYGDYVEWESAEAKAQNLETLKGIHAQLGWRLLLNEHIALQKDGEQIGLLGVENISGSRNFHSYGSLPSAYAGSEIYPFKILLSHDPSHWDHETNKDYKDIDLTLSGHTHGMQFGIEIPWLKWSPVQYVYKRWAGIYQSENQYLYVNRGFGFLGYPGRVGILPEITVIELT